MGLLRLLVSGEDVARGKPAPDGYMLGAERVGLRPADVLVFEDAPSGITAVKAAGMQVIALTTTHSINNLREADFRTRDLTDVHFCVHLLAEGVEVSFSLV